MNGKQRVKAVIAGKECDHLSVQPMLMMFAAKHAGIPYGEYCRSGLKLAEAQVKTALDFKLDVLLTCSDPAREVVDIAGDDSIAWFYNQPPAINEARAALLDKSRLNEFRVPAPWRKGRMNDRIIAIQKMKEEAGEELSIVGWVEGPLALAAELRGINHIMTDFLDDPQFVHDLLGFTAETAMIYAEAQVEAGADTIGMSDAAASLIGPALYEEFLRPAQCKVLNAIRGFGAITRLHMCGKTDPLIPKMKLLPVDIYELDFPVNLEAAREVLGPAKVILGNVSTVGDLLQGAPGGVYEAASNCHKVCGSAHIVGAGCEVSPMTPVENLRALVQYALDNRP